ncbi:MAG: BrnT family toxin [Gemmatimonadales bacterium]
MYTASIYSPEAYEWDSAKRESNLRKHGVDFLNAVRIFEGPVLERQDRRLDYGETRFVALGRVEDAVLAVVWTPRGSAFRIISARGQTEMKKRRIVKYNPRRQKDRTDWDRLRRQTDEDIARAVASDPDAAPIMDEAWWREARLVLPATKVPVSVRLDRDVLEWFKQQGPRYQSRINAVLRAFMEARRKAG